MTVRLHNDPDWLDAELAREDHRHGMAHGDDADHCGDCAAEARRRMQAECGHADVHSVEVTTLGQPRRDLLATCGHCGLSWREEGEWR